MRKIRTEGCSQRAGDRSRRSQRLRRSGHPQEHRLQVATAAYVWTSTTTPSASTSTHTARATKGTRGLVFRALQGPSAGRRSREVARRRPAVPMRPSDDVSHSRGRERDEGTPRSCAASQVQQARTSGDRAEPDLDLGRDLATRPEKIQILPAVRHPRPVQPLQPRVDARTRGEWRTGLEAHSRDLRPPRHRTWLSDPAC